jgi:hypothetical protein
VSFVAGDVEARLTLDRSPFSHALDLARREASSFAGGRYEATVSAATAGAQTDLQKVRALARSVGATDVDMEVDVDTNRAVLGLHSLRGATSDARNTFATFADNISSVFNVRLGALSVIVGGAAAAFAPLASAATVAGATLGTVAGGFGLVALAARDTFNSIQFENGKFLAAEGETLTQSQRNLVDALNRAAPAYAAALKPANDAFNSLAVQVLGVAQQGFPALGRAALDTMNAVSGAVMQVLRIFREPVEQASMFRILDGVPGVMRNIVVAAGSTTAAVVNIWAQAMPLVEDFSGWLREISNRFLEFTRSDAGRQQVQDFLDQVRHIAPQVVRLVADLASGIYAFSTNPDTQRGLVAIVDGVRSLVNGVRDAFAAFGELPGPVQDAIIKLGALALIVKTFGIVDLVSGIGGLVGKLRGVPDAAGRAEGSLGGLKALAAAGIIITIIATYDREAAEKEYQEAREHGKTRGLSVFEGFIEGMKSVPILGSFFTWYDEKFGELLGKEDRFKDEAEKAGGSIFVGIADGILNAIASSNPLTKPVFDGIRDWWGIDSPSTKARDEIGHWIGRGILEGITNAGLVSGTIEFIGNWFEAVKKARNSHGWFGIGGDSGDAIKRGLTNSGLIGTAISYIGQWFDDSKKKRDGQRWFGIGDDSGKAVSKGFTTAGLLKAAVDYVQEWFNDAKKRRDALKWFGIGDASTQAIKKGWNEGGLIGAAVALVQKWWDEAKKKRDSLGWWGIGNDAIMGLVNGWNAVDIARIMREKIEGGYNALKDWLISHSPSRRFAFLGRDSMLGYAAGFDGPEAEDAALRMVRRAHDAASRAYRGMGVPAPSAASPRSGAPTLSASASRPAGAAGAGMTISVPVSVTVGADSPARDLSAAKDETLTKLGAVFDGLIASATSGTELYGGLT